MPSWDALLSEFAAQGADADKNGPRVSRRQNAALSEIRRLREDRNVLFFYASAFLQKGEAPFSRIAMTQEDINGVMSSIHGMDFSKGLILLLHTPGGDPHAAETIVEYLRSKFDYIEVIVPAMAMSAGTLDSP